MNRNLLIKVETDLEIEKLFNYLKSINEPYYYNKFARVFDYFNDKPIYIGFYHKEWDWETEKFCKRFWSEHDRIKITYHQFFRKLKLERLCK